MKKIKISLLISTFLFASIFGYKQLSNYQQKNFEYFFKSHNMETIYDLTNLNQLSIFYDLLKKLHIKKSTGNIPTFTLCLLKDEIVSQNNKWFVFDKQQLNQQIKIDCNKNMFQEPNGTPLYKSTYFVCKNESDCQSILLALDDYLILTNGKIKKIEGKTIVDVDKSHFYNNILKIENPENVLFFAFNNCGIGNILSQYWGGWIYAQKWNKKLYPLDDHKIYKIFDGFIEPSKEIKQFKSKEHKSTLFPKIDYTQKKLLFAQNSLAYDNFIGYEDYIREHTVFKESLSGKNKEISEQMQNENSVSIHIRRGDFLKQKVKTLSLSYYKNAIKYIKEHVQNPHFYIFSNDIPWVKENLKIEDKHTFVDWNQKDYEDLHLMTKCKHNIIANSTFSWWGAFLNKNKEKIVITPLKGLYSEEKPDRIVEKGWIKIEE